MDGLDRALWKQVRRLVVDRDGDCTAAEWDHEPCRGGLDVHHVSDDPGLAYDPSNLTLLCDSHHSRLHALQRANERRVCPPPALASRSTEQPDP